MKLEEAIARSDQAFKDAGYVIDLLSGQDRILHLIAALDFELSNGGVIQWLVNQTGGYATETIEALRKIGATKTAQYLVELLTTFPSGKIPSDERERLELIEIIEPGMRNRWTEIGDRILDWPDDIDSLLRKFIDDNQKIK